MIRFKFDSSGSSIKLLAFGLVLALAVPAVQAQDFPSRRIRVLVSTGAGGTPDTVSRLVSQQMSSAFGQPVVVENRMGAGGTAAVAELLNSPPDGHTVFMSDVGQWAIFPAMQLKPPYDPLRDFAPIGLVFTSNVFIASRADLPAKTLRELIELAQSRPGAINYATPGIGSYHHLVMEYLASKVGAKFTHVPFRASSEGMESVLRGDTQLILNSVTSLAPHVKTDKVRLLAVLSSARAKLHPDVPTAAEAASLPGFGFPGTAGFVARAGTAKPIIDRLSGALVKALQQPEVIERINSLGTEATPSTPEQFAELMRADIKKYAEAIKLAGVKAQ